MLHVGLFLRFIELIPQFRDTLSLVIRTPILRYYCCSNSYSIAGCHTFYNAFRLDGPFLFSSSFGSVRLPTNPPLQTRSPSNNMCSTGSYYHLDDNLFLVSRHRGTKVLPRCRRECSQPRFRVDIIHVVPCRRGEWELLFLVVDILVWLIWIISSNRLGKITLNEKLTCATNPPYPFHLVL
jgi:hypothetical protein